jgi:AhpD family alkylhydroperoxidase
MTSAAARIALRRSLAQIRHVAAVPPGAADGQVAAVYAQVERDFGMLAPPVALHSPAAGPLAGCWLMLRETLLADLLADRAAKEAVAAAVSLANTCPYCVTVHQAVLNGLSRKREAAAISSGRLESINDPALKAVAAWARASGSMEAGTRAGLPFPAEQLPEFAGVVVTFQYLNRMVTVFLDESPFPIAVPDPVAAGLVRVLGGLLRPAARASKAPGASLTLLPVGPVPGDLAWAAGSQTITAAFARAARAIEAAGGRAAPASVRQLVRAELLAWDGRPRGIGRSWIAPALARLPSADRPAGALALLTAFAPHQLSQADIAAYRQGQRTDEDLIGLTAWASLAAARRVGTWLAPRRAPAMAPGPGG